MKARNLYVMLAALLLIGGGAYWLFFSGPHRFVDRSISEPSIQHLRSGSSEASWAASPADTAFEYLYWWPKIDRPNRSKIDISVSLRSNDEAVVTVIDRDGQGDSTYVTCDRITLHREGRSWFPVRHQAAWQGRGRLGWTTEPTL